MKCLSLWQPWASAIALGAKTIETRHWSTSYRGPLAIHAAKRCVKSELRAFEISGIWLGALKPVFMVDSRRHIWELLPFGAIVAVGQLVDCRLTGRFTGDELDTPRMPDGETLDVYAWNERDMGDFTPGRYGWVLEDVHMLPAPMPYRGEQGLFEIDDALIM